MGKVDTRALRVFHGGLAHEAQASFGHNRCPCCGHPMHRRKGTSGAHHRDRPSIGHDVSVARGGDETVWIWICQGCNLDQGSRSFAQWADWLKHVRDERAARVAAVAAFVEAWKERNGLCSRAA